MDDDLSYFRLQGWVGPTSDDPAVRDLVITVSKLPAILGRSPTQGSHINIDASDGTISREHIRVEYNYEQKQYFVTCLSKNGAVIDNRKVNKDDSVPIKQNSAMRVGTAKLYIAFPASNGNGEPSTAKKRKAGEGGTPSAKVSKSVSSSSAGAAGRAGTPMGGIGADDGELDTSTSSGRAKPGYKELILEAFASGQLPTEKDGGVNQKEIVSWILSKHAAELSTTKDASLKKGVYTSLTKHFDRIQDTQGGPILWIVKK